jgi:hypothetical protein
MSKCKYQISWVGRCNSPAGESELCEKHAGAKCCVCGGQAVEECNHTGQFVCGAPLCESCEGFTDQNKASGSWGFMNHTHRPRARP